MRQRAVLSKQGITGVVIGIADRAGIFTELFAELEFDRAIMEIHAKEGDRHGVLFNEGEIPGSDTEFLQEHRELPDRVRKSSNPEFPHTLILAIQSGLSITQN